MSKRLYLAQPEHSFPRRVTLSPDHLVPPNANPNVIAIVEDCETGERIAVRRFLDRLTAIDDDAIEE
jgi:hypothetical protein